MRHSILAVFFLAIALTTCANVTSAQKGSPAPSQEKVHAGREVFVSQCMQCHAVYEGQGSFGPNLSGEMKKQHPKKTTAEVKAILKNGKGKMPAFGEKLAPSDVDNLIAYLRTL